jgi:hypothetical protein
MARKTTVKTKEQNENNPTNEKEHSKKEVESASLETHEILINNKAIKLSPKSLGYITFQLGKSIESNELELKLVSVEGGGLHSKEWIKLSDIFSVLDCQLPDKPFKSGVFKTVFKGASANNASFLAAVLRSNAIDLISSTEKSIFLHQLNGELEKKKDALLKLVTDK